MATRRSWAQWHASAATLENAVRKQRRSDLGWWRDTPVWLENSGPDGAMRLVAWRHGVVEGLHDEERVLGSALYDYGAPCWAALSVDRLVVLRKDQLAVSELGAGGHWGVTVALDPAVGAGYLRRCDDHQFVVVVDYGPARGRTIEQWSLDGRHEVLYATPHLLSDLVVDASGTQLAWVQWPVGSMPWDTAAVCVGRRGDEFEVQQLTHHGAAAQPLWVGDRLWFDWEVGEWSSPWYWDGGSSSPVSIATPDGEFRPDWTFGRSWRAATDHGLLTGSVLHSRAQFGVVTNDDRYEPVTGGPDYLYEVASSAAGVIALGSSTHETSTLWQWDPPARQWTPIATTLTNNRLASNPQWRTTAGGVPFVWWTPESATHETVLDDNDRPGLVMMVHGGPTAYTSFEFSWLVELLLQSGFAVAGVDYRGSTSYGRSYRLALNGAWGSADVDDVLRVVSELVSLHEVNGARVFARGSSAGALTALLVSRSPLVQGAVSIAGVTDARQLAAHSDELESGYVAQLMGASAGDDSTVYQERSPREQVDQLSRRILVIHGADDVVVPVDQTRAFVAALRSADVDVEYLELEREGHGIRRVDNAKRAYAAELAFYRSPRVPAE